jgi:DNA-binding response OmpR family regulator
MKILVIEDEAKTIQLIKQGLEEQLWEVDVAYDGLIGLQLASGIIIHSLFLISFCPESAVWSFVDSFVPKV